MSHPRLHFPAVVVGQTLATTSAAVVAVARVLHARRSFRVEEGDLGHRADGIQSS